MIVTATPRPEGLPDLFFSIADALCDHLKRDAECGVEVLLQPFHIFGACFAGGINQRDWLESTLASNYILASLGLDIDPLDEPRQERDPTSPISKAETPGRIYILRNPSLPGLVKIGYTCQSVAKRIRQLSNTSIPTPFEVVASFETATPVSCEWRIHELLAESRKPGREFFSVVEAVAIGICESVIGEAS